MLSLRRRIKDRAIFLPHCLRSSECPAKLTPEGITCKNCGKCDLGGSVEQLRSMGYNVFIVPGSTFISRMVKKYRPRAIIGVGCVREVKDGILFADKHGITVMGIVNKTDGCVETVADWSKILETAALKVTEK